MASIYDLTGSFQKLWDLMDDGVLEDEVLQEVFENTTEELAIKLEGYCKFIKNCESDIAGLKAEEKRLKVRREVLEHTIERAKTAMKTAMDIAGEKKLPCGSFTVSVQKNPPSLKLNEDITFKDVPEDYLKFKDPEIDTQKAKDALKSGTDLDWCRLEQSESLRIK